MMNPPTILSKCAVDFIEAVFPIKNTIFLHRTGVSFMVFVGRAENFIKYLYIYRIYQHQS